MRHHFKNKYLFIVIMLGLVLGAHPAEAKRHAHHAHAAHRGHRHARAGVDRSASYSDIVIDAQSGQILHATNPDSLRHPASLTKMMTLYLTFQAIENGKIGLNQYLPVSEHAASQSPSKLGLRAGQRIKVEDAILGLVTESANDAAVVLAEWLGGSESGFAQLMTRQAQKLGMSRTHFNNASGLPNDGQITTARDMAVLGDALIYHFPDYYPYFDTESFTYAGIPHRNHNHLKERYEGMDGIKTGYIRASGFNLVASAKHGSTRLVGVVFGGHSTLERDNRMAQILDASFEKAQRDDDAEPQVVTIAPPEAEAEGDSADDNNPHNVGYLGLPAKSSVPRAAPKTYPQALKQPRAKAQGGSSNGSWGIQVGAFSTADSGQSALNDIVQAKPDILANARPQIQKISSGSVTMYRARLMSLDQETATSVCAWYVAQGHSCHTVSP